jgi:hypothetical protein
MLVKRPSLKVGRYKFEIQYRLFEQTNFAEDLMTNRYVFAVYAGRSGGMQTTHFFNRNVDGCLAINEFPFFQASLPGRLGSWQRHFHRKFIESHELLGRGKFLEAFVSGDDRYLEKITRRRIRMIDKELRKNNRTIYFDMNKLFARSIFRGVDLVLPKYSLVYMPRDPLKNMRSYLNRDKDFYLDNNRPEDACNELRLDSSDMVKGELYLWMWTELHLRFQTMCKLPKVEAYSTIRTEQMNDKKAWMQTLDELNLPYSDIRIEPPSNTNTKLGYGATKVTHEDVELFKRFLKRIPADLRKRVDYFDTYDPTLSVG